MNPSQPGVHLWHHCAHCGCRPLEGTRYHCHSLPEGPDNDLCGACYALYQQESISFPKQAQTLTKLPKALEFEAFEGQDPSPYQTWLTQSIPASDPPPVPKGFVVRPEFRSGWQSFFAAYGFVIRCEGLPQPVLLTALHVMDELIKDKGVDCSDRNPIYDGRELPGHISEVNLYDCFAANWMLASLGTVGPMLVLPNARLGDEEPNASRDIAAFRAELAACRPQPLAAGPPQQGEVVWQVADQGQGLPRTRRAVAVWVTPESLVYRFETPNPDLKYTSGSPIINQAGEVVGITVGGGSFEGHELGHANHAGNIRRHLAEAVE